MPFRTALSGLNASSADLRVIGNNVANASTTGYKKSRTEFADVFASSNLGSASNAIGTGVKVGSVSQQFTQGNVGFTDNNLDLAISGQGFFVLNDGGVNVFSRAGAFGVDRDGSLANAQGLKLVGNLTDANGNFTGLSGPLQLSFSDINPQATSSITAGINLDASAAVPVAPVSTSTISLGGANLDTGASPFTTPTFTTIDNYGNQVTNASMRFTYTGGGALWNVEMLVGGASTSPATTATNVNIGTDSVTLNWDPDGGGVQQSQALVLNTVGITSQAVNPNDVTASANGSVQSPFNSTSATTYNNSTSVTIYDSLGVSHLATTYYRKTGTPNTWETFVFVDNRQIGTADTLTFNTGGALTQINGVPATQLTTPVFNADGNNLGGGPATDITLTLDYSGLSQYGSPFSVNSLSQDGFATGRLSGLDISDTGVVLSRFTNGQSRTLAQIQLANFTNPQGLRQLGDSTWAESFESGSPNIGDPGTSSLGLVQSGALEGSNVDLTEQLVGMITAQRNFQANAQVISTADTITQAIINIR